MRALVSSIYINEQGIREPGPATGSLTLHCAGRFRATGGLPGPQKVLLFLVWFWARFLNQNGFRNNPNNWEMQLQNQCKTLFFLGSHFSEVLDLFRCLLGGFSGFLRSSWETAGPQKHRKTICFLWFFEIQLSAPLDLSMALQRPSWRPGGRSGTQNVLQKYHKIA